MRISFSKNMPTSSDERLSVLITTMVRAVFDILAHAHFPQERPVFIMPPFLPHVYLAYTPALEHHQRPFLLSRLEPASLPAPPASLPFMTLSFGVARHLPTFYTPMSTPPPPPTSSGAPTYAQLNSACPSQRRARSSAQAHPHRKRTAFSHTEFSLSHFLSAIASQVKSTPSRERRRTKPLQ